MTLPSKMPRPDVYYDVRVYPIYNTAEKYVILYNGVDWSLAHRGPGFYHRLGTYPSPEAANRARIEHLSEKLRTQIAQLRKDLEDYNEKPTR